MLIKKIEMSNFMVPGHRVLELPATGITLITGPNGSGKSAFGEGAATAWNRSIRNRKSRKTRGFRKGAGFVTVTTADGLAITRRVTKGGSLKMEFTREGEPPVDYATPTKAQADLEKDLGPFDLWRRSCVFSSADAGGFTQATDGERRSLLEDLLNLEQYAAAHDIAKAKLKAEVAEVAETQRKSELLRVSIVGVLARIVDIRANITSSVRPNAVSAFDAASARELVATGTATVTRLEAAQTVARGHCGLVADFTAAERTFVQMEDRPSAPEVVDLDGLRDEWGSLDKLVTGLEGDMEDVGVECVEYKTVVARAKAYKDQADTRAVKLAGAACPTCDRSIDDAFRDTLRGEVQEAADRCATAVKRLQEEQIDAQSAHDEIFQQLGNLRQKREALRLRGLFVADEQADYDKRIVMYDKRLHLVTAGLSTARAAMKESGAVAFTTKDHRELDSTRADVSATVRQLAVWEAQVNAYDTAFSQWEETNAKWNGNIAILQGKEAEQEEALLELGVDLNLAEGRVSIAEAGAAVLSPKGVRSHILKQALDAIQSICNRWLREFHGSLRVVLAPYGEKVGGGTKMAISLKLEGRETGDEYEDLSGGERRRLDLAMLLALAEVSRLVQGVTVCGTLFLDEILDAIDDAGVDAVCESISKLSETRSIVVITHKRAIRDRLHPVQEVQL